MFSLLQPNHCFAKRSAPSRDEGAMPTILYQSSSSDHYGWRKQIELSPILPLYEQLGVQKNGKNLDVELEKNILGYHINWLATPDFKVTITRPCWWEKTINKLLMCTVLWSKETETMHWFQDQTFHAFFLQLHNNNEECMTG
jgi:hypothetical protein